MTTARPTEYADSQGTFDELAIEPTATQTEGAAPDNDLEEKLDLMKYGVLQIVHPGELSPEQKATVTTLKANFEKHKNQLGHNIDWSEVEVKLNKEPAKLDTLKKLIDRGGEPTVTAKLGNGNFRFDEISKESPAEKRNVNWREAFNYAKTLGEGVQLMNKDVYNSFKLKGLILDEFTWSWLDGNPQEVESTAYAFGGRRGVARRYYNAYFFPNLGLRCSLEV